MALINKTDPEAVAGLMASSLEKHLDGITDVKVYDVVIPQSAGMTNDTVLFTADWTASGGEGVSRRLVARVAPTGEGIFVDSRLSLEVKVLKALASTDVAVPEVLFHETDEELVGAPFMVVEFRAGQAAADDPPFTAAGWVLDLAPEQRRALSDNGIAALASVHAVDFRAIGLSDLDASTPEKTALDLVLEDVNDFYRHTAKSLRNPTVERGLAWLKENKPGTVGESVLNWGDARFGNILYTDDQKVSAILDWEMLAVAPREVDLAWWTFLLRHHTDGIGVPRPDGLPSPEETVEYYEKITGYTVTGFRYYEVLAAVRLSILTQRAASLLIAAGVLPEGAPMLLANPATNLLAELAGIEGPGVGSASPMNRGA
ncbi:MAG: phosphotransferase family protein [Acidimicrobiaceae bacterium]|nr:phosphotransferase family protein [Acidimicrobiaceae bacterium]